MGKAGVTPRHKQWNRTAPEALSFSDIAEVTIFYHSRHR